MTSDLERARAIAIALEAEAAALREVLRAIGELAVVPYPASRSDTRAMNWAQRGRAVDVAGAARWAIGEGLDDTSMTIRHRHSRYTTEAEDILVAAKTLREQSARPLGYEPEQEGTGHD